MQDISFQKTLDLLPEGVLMANDKGIIQLVNAQLERMFGYPARELTNRHVKMLIPARCRAAAGAQKPGFCEDKTIRKIGRGSALTGLRKDGSEFDVSIALFPLKRKEGEAIFVTFRDTTKKMDLARALQWRNDQLKAINQSLESFSYVVSHDLKSPLANIQGIVDLIIRELPADKKEAFRDHIKHLHLTLHAMADMIAGIATYSKATLADISAGNEIDTNLLMKEVRALVLLPECIVLDIGQNLPAMWGNKTKVLQVFLNLISNAIKYNDKEQGLIRVNGNVTLNALLFSIEDNGPGIPPRLRKSVFTLFDKGTSNRTDSQGIGLAIVFKILQEMGGQIAIDKSRLGGARFKIALPLPHALKTGQGHFLPGLRG